MSVECLLPEGASTIEVGDAVYRVTKSPLNYFSNESGESTACGLEAIDSNAGVCVGACLTCRKTFIATPKVSKSNFVPSE